MSHELRLECQQTVVLSHCSQKEKDGMEDIYLVKNKGHMIRNLQGKKHNMETYFKTNNIITHNLNRN